MRTRDEVSSEKLRGGFYSPPELVATCLARVAELTGGEKLSVLEPSAGDGAFLRGLAQTALADKVQRATAIEVDPAEASSLRRLAKTLPFATDVAALSVLEWSQATREAFDVAVGNPPFVRFQFLSDEDKRDVARLSERLGLPLIGVANLWAPVLLSALSRLRPGGVFSFVVPTECLTGAAAASVRSWLSQNTQDLALDLFPANSFPGVLQEILVLSGRYTSHAATHPRLRFFDHSLHNGHHSWEHTVDPMAPNWSRYLLPPRLADAYSVLSVDPAFGRMTNVARLEVSIVTGANSYFTVDSERLNRYQLARWGRPLLARIRHTPGLCHTLSDQDRIAEREVAWLLDFASLEPALFDDPKEYLALGEDLGLPARYKCRIRDPWYEVPGIRAGELMLSKRSHEYPRLVLNGAGVVTTDTIYRGWMREGSPISAAALVAGFSNSLTLLSAEIEGRTFGGGVLELVPSEIGRLIVPLRPDTGRHFRRLDRIARDDSAQALIAETDSLVLAGIDNGLLECVREAHHLLRTRRLARNARASNSRSGVPRRQDQAVGAVV